MDVLLALGTNIGDRLSLIHRAIAALGTHGTISAVSPMYETAPWGFRSEHPFVNLVLSMTTDLTPDQLLDATQTIERQLGRTAKTTTAYSDRPIDIDIIDADGIILDSTRLTLPHPLMHRRNFVLYPLCDIAPQWQHPILRISATDLRLNSPDTDIPIQLSQQQD